MADACLALPRFSPSTIVPVDDTLSVSTCLMGFALRNQFAMLCVITGCVFISMARMYSGTVRMRKAAVSAAEQS